MYYKISYESVSSEIIEADNEKLAKEKFEQESLGAVILLVEPVEN